MIIAFLFISVFAVLLVGQILLHDIRYSNNQTTQNTVKIFITILQFIAIWAIIWFIAWADNLGPIPPSKIQTQPSFENTSYF